MQTDLYELIKTPKFSTGRRMIMYNQTRPIAVRLGFTRGVEKIDRGLGHDRETREQENLWESRGNTTMFVSEVAAAQGSLVQQLTSMRDIAEGHGRGLPSTDPMAIMSSKFIKTNFRGGITAFSAMPYVDLVAATETLVGKLRDDQQELVTGLGLTRKVEHLEQLTTEFRRLVELTTIELTFDKITALREQGHVYHLELLALIMGTYSDSSDPLQVRARAELLAPYFRQLAALRMYLRGRRGASRDTDDAVDPETSDDADTDDTADDSADAAASDDSDDRTSNDGATSA
jgi:hypothetical protein